MSKKVEGRNAASATAKLDPDLLRKAKETAVLEGVRLTEYLDRVLRGPVERDHARALRKVAARVAGEELGAS